MWPKKFQNVFSVFWCHWLDEISWNIAYYVYGTHRLQCTSFLSSGSYVGPPSPIHSFKISYVTVSNVTISKWCRPRFFFSHVFSLDKHRATVRVVLWGLWNCALLLLVLKNSCYCSCVPLMLKSTKFNHTSTSIQGLFLGKWDWNVWWTSKKYLHSSTIAIQSSSMLLD